MPETTPLLPLVLKYFETDTAAAVNLVFAGLSGASIPVMMKSIGLDPAQCSSIILTTVTDVMGFFSFLGFALLFRNFLL